MIVDVNANLSRWPFRRTPCDQVPRLVESFRRHGVGQAWVGSLDGLFHRDVGGVNQRLAQICSAQHEIELIPFGTVNPTLPDWQEDLRRCADNPYRNMPGIRLHPGYHGYRLDDPLAAELFDLAAEQRMIVQVAIRMDDIRVQHPLMQIPDVDARPLADLVAARPGLHVLVLNALATLRGSDLRRLAAEPRIGFEIAMREGVGGVASLLDEVPVDRVFFGSHAPLYPVESAWLKLEESGLGSAERQAIESGNARRLLDGVAAARDTR
jgi:uncharacterized protein